MRKQTLLPYLTLLLFLFTQTVYGNLPPYYLDSPASIIVNGAKIVSSNGYFRFEVYNPNPYSVGLVVSFGPFLVESCMLENNTSVSIPVIAPETLLFSYAEFTFTVVYVNKRETIYFPVLVINQYLYYFLPLVLVVHMILMVVIASYSVYSLVCRRRKFEQNK